MSKILTQTRVHKLSAGAEIGPTVEKLNLVSRLRSYERHRQTTTDRWNCDDVMRNVTYRSNVGLKLQFSTNLSLYLRNDTR